MLAINVHGGVTTCTTSRQLVGNLIEQPFAEVWENLGNKVGRKFPDGHPCAKCQFRAMCAGCPATVEQLTGLPEGYVQDYCRVTHLQAQALGYHATGVPQTVAAGIPAHVRTPDSTYRRALPVLS
jgi:radical SAM protein with 4Fe4S-binding SPASM domain